MFSTHPPLEERIRAFEPAWDGKFIAPDPQALRAAETTRLEHAAPIRPPILGNLLGGGIAGAGIKWPVAAGTGILLQTGLPTPKHLDYAADLRSKLPDALSSAAREPMTAVALVYALLLSKDDALRTRQLQQLQTQTDPGICQETTRLFAAAATLDSRARLPLASLAMAALRRLSSSQFDQFEKNIQFIIESDQQIELFEYTLQKIVLRQLEPNFKPPKKIVTQYYVLKPLVPDCAVLLSALAYAGQTEPAQVQAAFQQGAARLSLPDPALVPEAKCGLSDVDVALGRLNQVSPQLKKAVLNACAETVAADGVIQENEAELLRAIADTLDCPIPPFLTL